MNKKFKSIPGNVNEQIDPKLLQNYDIKSLHGLCILAQAGPKSSPNILKAFKRVTGKVNNARWITTANSVLVHYMQLTRPSKELKLLATFVTSVYAPTMFKMKEDFHISSGPKHLFEVFKLSKDLLSTNHKVKSLKKERSDLLEGIKITIRTNGFYTHIENVLLCMIMDDNPKLNTKAIEVIKKRRQQDDLIDGQVRKFVVPEINFNAKSYDQLINLNKYADEFSSPPILSKYSLDQIKKKEFEDDFYQIPCHSQSVERAVFLTSQAAEKMVGYNARHGWIINKLARAKNFPTNCTKEHFEKVAWD